MLKITDVDRTTQISNPVPQKCFGVQSASPQPFKINKISIVHMSCASRRDGVANYAPTSAIKTTIFEELNNMSSGTKTKETTTAQSTM